MFCQSGRFATKSIIIFAHAQKQEMARKLRTTLYGLQALARLWRVAHFVLSDFLNLSLQQSAETASPLLGLSMAPAESLMVNNSCRPVARASQRLPTPSPSSQKPKGAEERKGVAASAGRTPLQDPPDPGARCELAVEPVLCLLIRAALSHPDIVPNKCDHSTLLIATRQRRMLVNRAV